MALVELIRKDMSTRDLVKDIALYRINIKWNLKIPV